MSNFFTNTGKNLNTRAGLYAYTSGIVYAMNRFYRTGITQAIQDLKPYQGISENLNLQRFWDWLNDAMLLVEDGHHVAYWRALYYVHQHVCLNREILEKSED